MNQRLRDKLKSLQKQSETLEPSQEERNRLRQKVWQYSEQFLENLPKKKAFEQPSADADLSSHRFSEKSDTIEDVIGEMGQYLSGGLLPASAGHLGYIPGGSLYPSALGDFLAAITNKYAGVAHSGPGPVKMENECLRWLCDLIGYPSTSGGNLTSGGSIANLVALVNARDDSGISSSEFEDAVIYTTRQVHHCVIKAVKFAGLADAKLQLVEMDEQFRMKTVALEHQIEKDRQHGLKPLVIFASAGTTDVGAIDPLREIGKIAAKYDIWFHVDAAYGGMFLLTDYGKKMMRGIEKADSVTIDPHKGLFLPYGTGALLVKDVQKLHASQHMSANYLQDTYEKDFPMSPADLSPELSKHFRGLRMWLPLKLFGVSPFRDALNEKLLLTRYFYNEMKKIDYIETPHIPQLSVTYFRYIPQDEDSNAFNKKLVDEIHRDGRVFLSSTEIDETVYIRLAVLSFRTHLKTIDQTIAMLKEKINALSEREIPSE